jgi:hypothetical protein
MNPNTTKSSSASDPDVEQPDIDIKVTPEFLVTKKIFLAPVLDADQQLLYDVPLEPATKEGTLWDEEEKSNRKKKLIWLAIICFSVAAIAGIAIGVGVSRTKDSLEDDLSSAVPTTPVPTQLETTFTPTQAVTTSAPTIPDATTLVPTQEITIPVSGQGGEGGTTTSAPTQMTTTSPPNQGTPSPAPSQVATTFAPTISDATTLAPTQGASTSFAPTQGPTTTAPTQDATTSAPTALDTTNPPTDDSLELISQYDWLDGAMDISGSPIQHDGELGPGATIIDGTLTVSGWDSVDFGPMPELSGATKVVFQFEDVSITDDHDYYGVLLGGGYYSWWVGIATYVSSRGNLRTTLRFNIGGHSRPYYNFYVPLGENSVKEFDKIEYRFDGSAPSSQRLAIRYNDGEWIKGGKNYDNWFLTFPVSDDSVRLNDGARLKLEPMDATLGQVSIWAM